LIALLTRDPPGGSRRGAIVRPMTDRTRRPLLFLDVDGPLLPFGGSPLPRPREIVAVPHLARLRLEAGPRLARLPCTLVWATSWLEDANTEIAPRLGLPDLPVVTWPEPTGDHHREDHWLGLCWKTRALVNWAAGCPFAWVDDEITDADRDWVSAHHCGSALLRTIDASRGLTDEDFAALDAWLRGLP
jgi:HAD domain in Swiss Army Knife RNA repair proteins